MARAKKAANSRVATHGGWAWTDRFRCRPQGPPRVRRAALAAGGALLAVIAATQMALAGTQPLAGAQSSDPAKPKAQFVWPVADPVEIVRAFDLPDAPWLAGHRGVDLRAPEGTLVMAPADGTVTYNGWIVDRHVLVIRHGELSSTLEPVASDLQVGATVARGEQVGATAQTEAAHCPDCLHWGVRRGEEYLDPALLVEPRPRAVLYE